MADLPDRDRLTRLLSLAVHELRTPITVAEGYLRLLLRGHAGPLGAEQRRLVDAALRSVDRLAALVAELKDIGRLEAGSLELDRQRFDLAALVADVVARVHQEQLTSETRVEVHLLGAIEPLPVTGDRARLAAAVLALVRAVVRERADAETVAVTCRRIDVPAAPVGPWAVVSMGDAGETTPIVPVGGDVEPAFDQWRAGLGLALPLARGVIEAHGGSIWPITDARRGGLAFGIPATASACSRDGSGTG